MDAAEVSDEIHVHPESSSSSSSDPEPEPEKNEPPGVEALGDVTTPQAPPSDARREMVGPPPAPIEPSTVPAAPPVAVDLPAELVTAAAEAIPGASREWVRSLLRSCEGYGLDLALLVLAWAKQKRPDKPARYARVALSSWLNKMQNGALTLEDVRAEVQGRTGPRASPRPFDPSICLARMACSGWELVALGPDRVKWSEMADRSASLWKHIPSDLRQEIEAHRAELKAYVLKRASERGKTIALRA